MINKTTSILPAFLIFSFLFVQSNILLAQKTYKVVCDKTDNTVKVVEAENLSPNYVPIKSGFPFKQVAQKWIDENYSTTECNPGEITKQLQQQEENNRAKTTATNNYQPLSNQSTVVVPPRKSGINSTAQYKNTSFLINARFSNLGEAFRLTEKLMPGFEAGIEQLFGGKIYFGTGINMQFYFSKFDGDYDLENETLYFFRIPAFAGFRNVTPKLTVMYEAGAAFNSKITGTPLTIESFGVTPKSNSFDFLARMKVGSQRIMLELGTDIWITDMFENNSFGMMSYYVGLRFNF